MVARHTYTAKILSVLHQCSKVRGGGIHIAIVSNMAAKATYAAVPVACEARFSASDLSISETLALMWRDDEGDVEGRVTSLDLKMVLVASGFLDLVRLGRLEFLAEPSRIWGCKHVVLVADDSMTGNVGLDTLLSYIIKQRSGKSPRSLRCWLHHLYLRSSRFVAATFASLVDRGIVCQVVDAASCFSSTRFPTENQVACEQLKNRLRAAVLVQDSHGPFDLTALACLVMLRLADRFYVGHLVLGHIFSEQEISQGRIKDKVAEMACLVGNEPGFAGPMESDDASDKEHTDSDDDMSSVRSSWEVELLDLPDGCRQRKPSNVCASPSVVV